MRRSLFIGCILLILSPHLRAAEGEYAVSRIPAALLKDAHVVKRMETILFEVRNTGEAIMYRKYALTILNENGDAHAAFAEYYDKLHEIRNIEGTLYDANGKELKKLRNRQVIDVTGSDDNSLIDDFRLKVHHFYHKNYPYTVEYIAEIRYYGTLFFPDWVPRERESYSVQQSRITITTPNAYTARFRAFNYPGEPVTAHGSDAKSMTWEVKDLPAVRNEFAAPPWHERNTAVFFGPADFKIENHPGSMRTWKEFGNFIYTLNKGRDRLPENIRKTVHDLTDAETDTGKKVAKLYAYMQNNTRYISIQLGIGGWQPFDAGYVASKAYGDCKALTNYMYSLLKEAGIPSVYTLVRAGRDNDPIIEDFPSSRFNHAILFVPTGADTIWLECTSQTLPAGYLGDFTCNRKALAITSEGGVIVNTPRYGLHENTEVRRIRAILDEEATLHIDAETVYSGLQQDEYHMMINGLSKDKIREWLHQRLDFATYDIVAFDFTENRLTIPTIIESLDIKVSNYATITGKRLFITPNIMTRSARRLPAEETRINDLVLPVAYRDIDTVEIEIPEGYKIEAMPKPVVLNTPYGQYASSITLEGKRLLYYRHMDHFGGRFPASEYQDLVKFYDNIYKADRSRVVLVREEQ